MHWKSDNIDKLCAALVAAQSEMHDAKKDAVNPHFKSKYADLASVREAVREPLAKHGLAVVQMMAPRSSVDGGTGEIVGEGGALRTVLLHVSGQWIAGEHQIVGDWANPQKIGSAITYARRYGLAAICGIAQDDDDGEHARPRSDPARREDNRPPPKAKGDRFYREQKPVPQTGAELVKLIRSMDVGVELLDWASEFFLGEHDYPDSFDDWSREQVGMAIPVIRARTIELRKAKAVPLIANGVQP